jgi:hypothetical protein
MLANKTIITASLTSLVLFEGFRAWFILQHLRGYKPFITVVENQYEISEAL